MFEGKLLKEHVDKYNVPGHRLIPCEYCHKKYANNINLNIHKTLAHTPSLCQLCGRNLLCSAELEQHMRCNHRVTNIIKCQYCNVSFNRVDLKQHLRSHMNLPKQFVCDDCGKCFTEKRQVKSHIANVHVSNICKCRLCNKTFKTHQLLKAHLLQHTSHKPYQCQRCPLTFKYWGNCNIHMKIRHGISLAKTKRTAMGRWRKN